MPDPVFHKFVVFSKVDESDSVIPKMAKCNNCGVIHKVVDICKSEITHGLEDTLAVISVKDIRSYLPENICQVLDSHKCDIATWEQIDDIVENKLWDSVVTISREQLSGSTQIKQIIIREGPSFKIQSHLRKDLIE
tara:strand:- start:12 stop:419 length:408 start_codon:yes stop_codon:yes gene_type:complete